MQELLQIIIEKTGQSEPVKEQLLRLVNEPEIARQFSAFLLLGNLQWATICGAAVFIAIPAVWATFTIDDKPAPRWPLLMGAVLFIAFISITIMRHVYAPDVIAMIGVLDLLKVDK